jgi:uncharacterized membrane protein
MKKISVTLLTIMVVAFAGYVYASNFTVAAKPVQAKDGVFSFPVSEFQDGKARHYEFSTPNGEKVRFFVVKAKDGAIRSALDACEVCYKAKKGYVQQGNDMICINCGQKFKTEKVGDVKGGCNPHPVKNSIQGDKVTITQQELLSGVRYFQ